MRKIRFDGAVICLCFTFNKKKYFRHSHFKLHTHTGLYFSIKRLNTPAIISQIQTFTFNLATTITGN